MQRSYLKVVRAFILRRWVHPLDHLAVNLTARKAGWWRDGLIGLLIVASQLGRLAMTMLRVNVKRLKGPDWSVIYIGEEFSVEELRHVLFPSPASVDHLDRVFLWQVPALVRRLVNDGEFVVCELNRLIPWRPRARYVFPVTPWVKQVLDIDRPLDAVLAGMNRSMHRDLRKMREAGFTCEFTQDPAQFDIFYHEMYVPYIAKRHQDRAIVGKYYEIRSDFENGGLVLIRHKERLVAGAIYQVYGDLCQLGVMGMGKGSSDLVGRGAVVAIIWSVLEWARRQGLRTLDIGGSRGYLANGVFRFKRKWGTYLKAPLIAHTGWWFIAETMPPDLCRLINSQGFLGQLDGEWWTVMFETPEVPLAKEEVERTSRMAQKAGAAGVRVLGYHQLPPAASPVLQSADL